MPVRLSAADSSPCSRSAVEAPGWVVPVGGIAAIGTALLPVLLAPGEEAFNRQQDDEDKVSSQFGKRRK